MLFVILGSQPVPGCSVTQLPTGGLRVNCKGKNLTEMPTQLPENTETIHLDKNYLTHLKNLSFYGCIHVLEISITENNLTKIDGNAFSGLTNLTELSLVNNYLNFSDLPSCIFQPLISLKRLETHRNAYKGKSSYNTRLYGGLTKLVYLSLDGIPHANFDDDFSGLRNIQVLYIEGDMRYIGNTTLRAFSNTQLRELNISSNLFDLDKMAFGYLCRLTTLDLSYNSKLGFQNASKAWYGLQFTRIDTLILENIAPLDGDIEVVMIKESFYNGLENTNLTNISISNNDIALIESNFSNHTPLLEELSLAYNRITHFMYLFKDLYHLKHLRRLNAQFQNGLFYVDNGQYPGMLNANTLSSRIHNRYLAGTGGIVYHVYVSEKLEYLNLQCSYNKNLYYLPKSILLRNNYIRYVNYAQNQLHKMIGPVRFEYPPPGSVIFDLSQNDCEYVHRDLMKYVGKYISELSFSQNKLGKQLSRDVNGSVLRYLTSLLKLDLSFNYLTSLPPNVFLPMINMQILNLANNNLQLFNFNVSLMVNLTYLDLSSNMFAQIFNTGIMATQLINVRKGDKFTIQLSDNVLACSCDSRTFLEWFINTPIEVKQWVNYTCLYHENITDFAVLQSVIIPSLNIECRSKELLIISSFSACFMALLIALSVILYRHRFEIKYSCLKHILERKKYDNVNTGHNYTYDAFVAFHTNEFNFVEDTLIPRLEDEGSPVFKLCVHYKHFLIGANIEENIIDAILKSRKTILLLSKGFVLSGWCEFEYRMARVKGFDEGRDIIIPVIMEELPVQLMTKSLRALLDESSYIEWPDNPNQRDEFWLKLREALQ